jgi:hypothetical protein
MLVITSNDRVKMLTRVDGGRPDERLLNPPEKNAGRVCNVQSACVRIAAALTR